MTVNRKRAGWLFAPSAGMGSGRVLFVGVFYVRVFFIEVALVGVIAVGVVVMPAFLRLAVFDVDVVEVAGI
jgi:hypothetical protein